MAEEKKELTTRDMAKMFDVSRQSIFNWRRKKEDPLKYYKLSGNGLHDPTRYRLKDAREFSVVHDKPIICQIFIPPAI